MSFNYYPAGMYGIKTDTLFPPEIFDEMRDAYRAAEELDPEIIASGEDENGNWLYPERYRRVLKRTPLHSFESEPGEFVRLAFAEECEKYVPGYRKMMRFSTFVVVPSDADTTDTEPGDMIYGIGVGHFPLEKRFKRAKVPQEFCSKADLFMWVVGG